MPVLHFEQLAGGFCRLRRLPQRGAIVGMEWTKPVTGDLAKDGAARYAQLAISGNRVR